MTRLLDVIAARLLEGSLIPFLGGSLLRAPPFPPDGPALAAWLGQRLRSDEAGPSTEGLPQSPWAGTGLGPAAGPAGLAEVAAQVEQARGRRGLLKLLREAYGARAEPGPFHFLLAGLPTLPLVVSTAFDGTLLDLLRELAGVGGRSVALLHGVAPRDGAGVFFAEATAPGLTPAEVAQTVLYQPLGGGPPASSFLVTEADAADTLVALETQAPIPPEVQRRRHGAGFLFAGSSLERVEERLLARGVLQGAAGPHFAVMAAPPSPAVARFFSAEGITVLGLTHERFVAELSRWLARAAGEPAGDLA